MTVAPAGNRSSITEHDGTVRSYDYDNVYRLTGERVSAGSGLDYEKLFTYDRVGNRLTQTTTGAGALATPIAPGSVGYAYDTRDRLIAATLGSNPPTDYTYDDNGNVLTRSGDASYAWDVEDRLVRVEKTDGPVVEYAYDADGNRVSTKVTWASGLLSLTNYLVDPTGSLSHVVAETTEAGALMTYYVRGDDLLALMRPDGTGGWTSRFYHADAVGSIRQLTDESGAVTDTYTYTAFGELIAHTGLDPQPYAFTGQPYDPNVGFQYHRARWLDPSVGRFAGLDPFRGDPFTPVTLHVYLYAGANPVNQVDPSGLMSIGEMGAAMQISVQLQVTALRAGLMTGRTALWTFFRSIGAAVENQVFNVLTQFTRVGMQVTRNIRIVGPNATRYIDFLAKAGDRVALIEVKYRSAAEGRSRARQAGLADGSGRGLGPGPSRAVHVPRAVTRTAGTLSYAIGPDGEPRAARPRVHWPVAVDPSVLRSGPLMRKELSKAVRTEFTAAMARRLPQFVPVTIKSRYAWPGSRIFRWVSDPSLHFFVELFFDPKGDDSFGVEVGWSRLGRYPEVPMRPGYSRGRRQGGALGPAVVLRFERRGHVVAGGARGCAGCVWARKREESRASGGAAADPHRAGAPARRPASCGRRRKARHRRASVLQGGVSSKTAILLRVCLQSGLQTGRD